MRTATSVLSEILNREKELDLYSYLYMGFPIWRLYRFACRNRVLKRNVHDYTNNSLKRANYRRYFVFLKKSISSFILLLKLLISRKHIDNAVFAFPRLQFCKDLYIDKFTDPVIDRTNLAQSVCVFQNSSRIDYSGKRWKKERVISTDFLVLLAYTFCFIYSLFVILTPTYAQIKKLHKVASPYFYLNRRDLFIWILQFSNFALLSYLYKLIFRSLRVKRIFVVDRGIFIPQIFAAHKLNLCVYEFQHGVTFSDTPLYAGPYNILTDPDYFLAFGDIWKGRQFAVPVERILNIGWAYKTFISIFLENNKYVKNGVLLISSPEKTERFVQTALELAKCYQTHQFYIRCHPQELMPENLKKMIELEQNVFLADNRIDSYIAISSYEYIIGENSSVLYEALSLGKKVGRLAYNGFVPLKVEGISEDGFYYFFCKEDFKLFIQRDINQNNNSKKAFSDFNVDAINSLLK